MFHLFNLIHSLTHGNHLLVIAHPDDEIMFFTPLIQNLKGTLTIICLSTGNFYGQGNIRKKEIQTVISELNKNKKLKIYLELLNTFQDNENWNIKEIRQIIEFYNFIYNYDSIFTFDEYGVSGHKNHISCYWAVKGLENVRAKRYYLKSKSVLRKYFVDVVNVKCVSFVCVEFWLGVRMMVVYESQMEWFRYLYVLFSNYMKYNEFQDF